MMKRLKREAGCLQGKPNINLPLLIDNHGFESARELGKQPAWGPREYKGKQFACPRASTKADKMLGLGYWHTKSTNAKDDEIGRVPSGQPRWKAKCLPPRWSQYFKFCFGDHSDLSIENEYRNPSVSVFQLTILGLVIYTCIRELKILRKENTLKKFFF
ncbi:hypothetical protein I3842_02G059900 [Carya illinoinensis]|uniref:Uncharacterized protein n=1 Tax=Carya illinoinensis TaxID=32201 RepID=A0A922JYP6_CARIL|nr:hypothetical protein I3842_02G059900 [Carya illinoinensis]